MKTLLISISCTVLLVLWLPLPAHPQSISWESIPDFWGNISSDKTGTLYLWRWGFYRSTDDGNTWHLLENTPFQEYHSFYAHTNGHLYLGGDGKLYRSTDGGEHWSDLNIPPEEHIDVTAVTVAPNGIIYAGTRSADGVSLYASFDDGRSWQKNSSFRRKFPSRMISYYQPITQLIPTSVGLLIGTFDRGAWLLKGYGLHVSRVPLKFKSYMISLSVYDNGEVLAICRANPGYPRYGNGGLYRSFNLKRWTRIDGGAIPGYPRTAIKVGTSYFIATTEGVFQSSGGAWVAVNSGLPLPFDYTKPLPVDYFAASSSGKLFISWSGNVYRSSGPVAGSTSPTGTALIEENIPYSYALYQNYPNPFNPATTIEFELANEALVTAKVYNALGQQVAVLADRQEFEEGTNELEFDANSLSSGVYFCKFIAEDVESGGMLFSSMRKMLLVK